ncbi:multicopper oxidase family protein [Williamsia herbipolensis]|uniref:multicopper oxidase family protein n=1 Tax=Williamsia herbipolensis TaxID=1603258 RepID=UPI0005F7676C|nr:multicopper oxidase family protein [Williamsia herbipolensis]
MNTSNITTRPVSRRTFLGAAAMGLTAAAAACGTRAVSPVDAHRVNKSAIDAAEARRPHTGRTVSYTLDPRRTDIDLGGPVVNTYAYGDTIPGSVIRANVGDELSITTRNALTDATSVHWHGIALRNDMDGAAPATPDIAAGDTFTYRFSVPDSGTYWAHPHVGLQSDFGLYAPIIIDDPREPHDYDTEWIVVLDDWTDGVGKSPRDILTSLQKGGMSMGGMSGGSTSGVGTSALLGGDAGDVAYPLYLVNGRIANAPTTFTAAPGQRIRIRIINAGADTAFRVALGGHRMTVTHTDGFPVTPIDVDALLIGMSERYDVVVTVKDGVFPLVASPEGKTGTARALLRTGAGATPAVNVRPAELDGFVGTVNTFVATDDVTLPHGREDAALQAMLGGTMSKYQWTINGRVYEQMQPIMITQGQRASLTFTNTTTMWHPMHLHGHTFQVRRPDGTPGPRKDTVAVRPGERVVVDLVADNPGQWMLHCHNAYHQDAGMMTRLDYRV